MTFQAYLDNIRAKTGKGPEDFKALAAARGLLAPGVKAGAVTAWLKEDFGLGSGHAMAIYATFTRPGGVRAPADERLAKLFSGGRARWREAFEVLLAQVREYGDGVGCSAADKYVSLIRDGKKFAIVQPGASYLDLGFKVPGAGPTARFAAAGGWNPMVTHRARVLEAGEIDAEVLGWLRRAFEAAGGG